MFNGDSDTLVFDYGRSSRARQRAPPFLAELIALIGSFGQRLAHNATHPDNDHDQSGDPSCLA